MPPLFTELPRSCQAVEEVATGLFDGPKTASITPKTGPKHPKTGLSALKRGPVKGTKEFFNRLGLLREAKSVRKRTDCRF